MESGCDVQHIQLCYSKSMNSDLSEKREVKETLLFADAKKECKCYEQLPLMNKLKY